MKSWSKNKGPGRKPKFVPGEIVRIKEDGTMAVVVDYRQDKRQRGEYRVVRLIYRSQPIYPAGRAVWYKANLLDRTEDRAKADIVRSRYNANERIGERGCSCQCCIHEAYKPSDVRPDGTYVWEMMNDTEAT